MNPSFFYTDEFLNYDFSGMHPLKPIRLKLTYEAMQRKGIAGRFDVFSPRKATENELLKVHTLDYIQAVREAEKGIPNWRYGLGTPDNPLFSRMYSSSLVYTGASISAAEHLFTRDISVNISGGLHHAHPSYASGFCIFNDVALSIVTLLRKYAKIAYIDIDAHHADGVQEIFYRRKDVLTISIHESGEFLFPGTGFPHEIGEGEGKGYSVNLPLYPHTGDDVYIESFEEIVPPLIEAFNPDVIVSQLGVDNNVDDPLAHLQLTIPGFLNVVDIIKGLNQKHVFLGGGGYSLEVVPEAWSEAMALISGVSRDTDVELGCTMSKNARDYAQTMVSEVKRRIFPYFGLPC